MCLGIPGEIVELREEHGLRFASVRFGGVVRDACMEYEPEAGIGDYVLVHVGFAISRIDRAQAEHAWEVLTATGQTSELEPPP